MSKLRSFRDFMEEKIREYYTSSHEKFSSQGDFFTAPELDRAFGEAIAEFIYPYISTLESPVILELGAGRGLMAMDILNRLKEKDEELFKRTTYLIYEFSPYLREVQKNVLKDFDNVDWIDSFPKIEGVVISNEFFDCLPVHVVKKDKELYINENGEEVWLSLENERIKEFLERMNYKELDQRIEVCLDCIDMLKKIADSLIRGYNLIIDYGYTSEEITRFPEGTVLGYSKHKIVEDIYENRRIDLSAFVNFSALIEYGKDFGLEPVVFDTQRNFLASIPHFILELETLSMSEKPEDIERLSRLKTMLVSMGDRFKVLFQKKVR